ncbi:MAG: 4Fe-4S dicluster domain-containing protein [Coriobacteriia bacterium]|nr:4Fe-4S dicluster domain-containing protein [Coriobacteriia bacterium]
MSIEEDKRHKLDFGAGNVAVLPSRCLRIAKKPTDCDLCVCACPALAITPKELHEESPPAGADNSPLSILDKKMGVKVSEDCIHCSLCTTACPVESLSNTQHHPKSFEKQVADRALKLEGLALSCARALYGVAPRLAAHAISLPCLAALTSESWFFAATSARDAIVSQANARSGSADEEDPLGILKVYLPALICDGCPVNLEGKAEKTFLDIISAVESWGVSNIELVSEPEHLSPWHSGNLMSSLSDASSGGKREAAEQLASTLMRSWMKAGEDLSLEKRRTEALAAKRKQNTRKPAPGPNVPRPFGKKSQRRRLLRAALEHNRDLAHEVELTCADTLAYLCTGCGVCVDVCPLGARRTVTSNSIIYFGKLPKDEQPKESMAAITDKLCCLGCSACVIECPTGACVLASLPGEEFLALRQT